MKCAIPMLAFALLAIPSCESPSDGTHLDESALLEHLGNVIAVSALSDEAIEELDKILERTKGEGQGRDSIQEALNSVQGTTMEVLSSYPDRSPLDPEAELQMESLVEIMNLTNAIAKTVKIELALRTVVYKKHKCDRIGTGGQCVSNSRYNCSHIDGSCFHTKKK